jgi:hypothetical protein
VTPEELTLGQLRRALAGGLSKETVREALERLDAGDELLAQNERTTAA